MPEVHGHVLSHGPEGQDAVAASGKGKVMAEKWVQSIHMRKGALHRALGIPQGKTIPYSKKVWASKQPGRLGRMGRLALTLGKMKH